MSSMGPLLKSLGPCRVQSEFNEPWQSSRCVQCEFNENSDVDSMCVQCVVKGDGNSRYIIYMNNVMYNI